MVFPTQVVAQSFTFSTVSIEGNQRIEDGTILTYAGLTRGETVSAAELNDAGQRIRESGLFESVEIIPNGTTLRIVVVEFPTINRINIEGNSRLRDEELLQAVQSQPRRVYSPAQAERDVEAITQAYAQQGRVNATVTPRIIARSDNRVDLVFEVFEGGLTEVERISFVGNRTYSDRRLRGVLNTKQAGVLRAVVGRDTYVADRVQFDQQLLTDFYQSRGYVDFQIQNVDVSLTRERDAYLVTFNIQEGQQFRMGDVYVSSELTEADPDEFERALRSSSGDVYSPTRVDNDIARIERLAIQKGLNFVRVEPRITRNDRDLTLDVEYVLTRGDRIFIERIDIEGNNTTLDRVVRNQFDVVEGDPFNPRQIRQSADRIRRLGYFGDANVDAREGSSPNHVVIDVDVVEKPTGSLTFGANYNSDAGVSLIASFKEQNFLGRGQRVNAQLSTAETNRVLSFSFVEPQLVGRDTSLGFSFGYRRTDNENSLYDTETFSIRPSLTFPVGELSRLQVFYGFEYLSLFDVDADASPIIHAEEAFGGIGYHQLGYQFSYDNRRSGLNPEAGVLLRFGQEFGVGEDSQYIKTTAFAAAETRVFHDDVTLRAIVEGGLLHFSEGDSRVTDRFFLGSAKMRGFSAGGIGPRDVNTGDALGGNAFAVARLEAEFPLGLPEEYGITGGAFYDYGSVWDVGVDSADILYNDFTPRSVVGLSLFWTTPIGPLRFNFTEALDAQEQDETRAFDVTVSTSF
ncbi:outer membrane protein assembly factor BamA [Aestuariibius sp. HNIBRBA575]|uniref:outer membrane protein assembly factor BamA n=1 Tax=Aestuariibius sp. HNIBRBA575 TaxID=3233343 RepID=UPI0034A2A6AA